MYIRIANFAARWNLVQRFNIVSLIAVILGAAIIGIWVSDQIEASIINESAATVALYLDSFVTPNLQELAQSNTLTQEHFSLLKSLLQDTDLGRQVVAIKVWDENGRILFSNSPSLIGRVFSDPEDLGAAWGGQVVAKLSDLNEPENIVERQEYQKLLEIYVPVRETGSHKVIAIAEFYQKVDVLEAEIKRAQMQSWLAVGAGMAFIYLWLIGFFQWARNRLAQQESALKNQVAQLTEVLSQNNELDQRIRQATANATTLNEILLRRISTELTNGPVKDINLAVADLNQAMNGNKGCLLVNQKNKCDQNLQIVQASLQASLQEMHTIAMGLGLPQLDSMSITDIFMSVVKTHEYRTGTKVDLRLKALPGQMSLPLKITAYRIVQEALNNAYRHAGGIGQAVQAALNGNELQIEISDLGPGFENNHSSTTGEEHLGLVGMRERVESLGGVFSVVTKVRKGTKISARLLLSSAETA